MGYVHAYLNAQSEAWEEASAQFRKEYKRYAKELNSCAQKRKKLYRKELKKVMAELDREENKLSKRELKPEDPDKPFVRQFCLFLEGLKDTDSSREVIKRHLNDRDNDTSTMANLILAKNGDKKAARRLAKSSFENGGFSQQLGLANFGSANFSYSTNFLFNNLNNGSQPGNRIASLTGLKSKIGKPRVKDAFVWALSDPDPRVKIEAINDTAPWAGPKEMAKIVKLKTSSDIGVHQAVIRAVGLRLKDYPKNLGILTAGLNNRNPAIFSTSLSAAGPHLKQFPQLRQPFIDVVRREFQPLELCQFAMHSLAVVHTPPVKNLFVSKLDHPDWRMREGATFGLSRFGGTDIPDLLTPKIQDSAWQVRQTMALSFGKKLKVHPQFVNPFVRAMKTEDDSYTRHIFAAALKTIPNYPDVKENWNSVQGALIPGLRIGGWEKVRPETGVEIGYNLIAGPINHTFLSVTYNGDTKILSFDTKEKPLGFLLPQSRGKYFDSLQPGKPVVMYHTLTTDPIRTKKLYDLSSDLYEMEGTYNLLNIKNLGENCYGGRNFALESIGISSNIPDSPWQPLKSNYFSRSISMDSADFYSSYSLRMKQDVLFSSPGARTIRTGSWTNYNTRPWSASTFNTQRTLPNSWTNRSFQTSSSLNSNFRWKAPSFSSTGFGLRSWSSFSFPRSYFRSSFMPRTYSPPQRYIPPPTYTPPPRYDPPTFPSNPWP